MNLNEYQDLAKDTAIYPGNIGLEYTVLGLCGEAGELANKLKKVLRDLDGDVEKAKNDLIAELGDCLWYVAMVAKELDTTLETVAIKNIGKLAVRKTMGSLHGSGDSR